MTKEVNKLKEEIERLKKELQKERHEKQQIEHEKQQIEHEKQQILEEKRKVEKEFEEFKLKHAGTVAQLRKAMHLKPNLSVKKKGLGAKKEHKAYTRHIPDRIDYIKELKLNKCPDCGLKILGNIQEFRQRYVTDIKITTKVFNTKYNIPRKYCTHCKKIVEPTVPNVLPHARFGLSLMLLIIYLRIGLRLPIEKVAEFLNTMFQLKMGRGEIILICHQVARAYGSHYKYLEQLLKIARVKHTDTTSWRTEAKNYTAWTFVAAGIVLYKITRRGNASTAEKMFGKKQEGHILVVDRHSVNRSLAEKCGFILQMCWSHILQDSKNLARDFGREGTYVHQKMKQIFADAKSLDHQATPGQVNVLKERIRQLSIKHYKHKTVWKFVKNLTQRDLESLFVFVTNQDVDPTNNISERQLRTLVVFRNITNGSRSEQGSQTIATLFSIIQTLKLQNKNILYGLQEILKPTSGS